uniref:Uncharacterized protein n=1 Tax=Ananas comosus var. bracteatus TaxID=296719 RepID=A0A6V7PFH0_ANACO|nr:unnamed protein product [Ananas comosus var. bracteatus]
MLKLPDLALGAVVCLYHRSLWAVDTQDSAECIYARVGMPSLFLQQCLGCSEVSGAVDVDGGPRLLFLHQIVPRAPCESLIELDRDTLAYSSLRLRLLLLLILIVARALRVRALPDESLS